MEPHGPQPVVAGANGDDPAPKKADLDELTLKKWDRILATITALGVVFGGFWTAYSFVQQRGLEYRSQQRKEKRELFQPFGTIAASIATAKTLADADTEIHKFWTMYYGSIHTLRDDRFEQAKINFGEALRAACQDDPKQRPPDELQQYAEELAEACRDSTELADVYHPPGSEPAPTPSTK